MCFDQDCDWYASVFHENKLVATEEKRCVECGVMV